MKTVVNGIEFRSRTEAAWFLVLEAYGLDPVYEPQTYELRDMCGDEFMCWYMPDFEINFANSELLNNGFVSCESEHTDARFVGSPLCVEVKAGVDGEVSDIAKACVLGYEKPTLIIIGWPLHYRAVVIFDRHKGNPRGNEIVFSSDIYNRKWIHIRQEILLGGSYPDEDWLVLDEDDVRRVFWPKHKPAIGTVEGDIAREAWNATKWKR